MSDGQAGRSPICRPAAAYIRSVSTQAPDNRDGHLELSVEELLRRACPLPPHDEMVIEDLSEEEGAAFLAAVESEQDPVARLESRCEPGLVRESTHDEG